MNTQDFQALWKCPLKDHPPHPEHGIAEPGSPAFAGRSCLSCEAFPLVPDKPGGVADILPAKHYKQTITLVAAQGG